MNSISSIRDKRNELKVLIAQCSSAQQLLFKRMYSPTDLACPINIVIDRMEVSKVSWAIQQCKNTSHILSAPKIEEDLLPEEKLIDYPTLYVEKLCKGVQLHDILGQLQDIGIYFQLRKGIIFIGDSEDFFAWDLKEDFTNQTPSVQRGIFSLLKKCNPLFTL